MSNVEQLVARLQKANYAYHNNGEEVMGDDEYDRGIEELKRLAPSHPFLSVIGAPVAKNAVLLPYTMASLDKVRYGESGLNRFVKRVNEKQFMIMEKLDGLSALYVSNGKGMKKLYLRGDGVKGVDISRAVDALKLPPLPCVIRGEIILPLENTPKGSIGRSLVNGWLHRILDISSPVPDELQTCHFIAYKVIEPANMIVSKQLEWLKPKGFHIPQHYIISDKELTEEKAKEILLEWKGTSKYPLDGIVVNANKVPTATVGGEAKNPDDAVAFKAALDEQKEETSVVQVEWNLSRQGMWIPRIQVEQVEIGGAKIQWLSGHNAAAIHEGGIGPGARIILRRSGDVIPTLDTVLQKAPGGPSMPQDGSWIWDQNKTHAIMKAGSDVGQVESQIKSILHALTTLEVEGIGPGLVKKMVEGGFTSLKSIYHADVNRLAGVIGGSRAPKLMEDLKREFISASQVNLLIASNLLPRGIGEKKLRALYSVEADAMKWNKNIFKKIPTGWTQESLEPVLAAIPAAFEWIQDVSGIKIQCSQEKTKEVKNSTPQNAKYIVFTGGRDKEILSKMESKGFVMEDSITKKTNILVVADADFNSGKESTKMKKAKENKIEILPVSKFRELI
jgi:DNA ligase (NAD+)